MQITEYRISELKERAIEFTQSEQKRKIGLKKEQ